MFVCTESLVKNLLCLARRRVAPQLMGGAVRRRKGVYMCVTRLRAAFVAGIATLVLATQVSAQRVECILERESLSELRGACSGLPLPGGSIILRPVAGSETDWSGTITLGEQRELTVEIVSTPGVRDEGYVFRSDLNWFNVVEWSFASPPYRLVFDRSDVAAPTAADIAILREARRLLVATPRWDRADDRDCGNDAEGVLGLYCALARATRETMGKYYHRQPAMQRVRRAIDEQWRDRVVSHRLMDFNNHQATTLDDVIAMLDRALEMTQRELAK